LKIFDNLKEEMKHTTEALQKFFEKISRDDIFTQAGALSYATALGLAPMVILLISFFSFLRFDLQAQFLNETGNLIGSDARKVFESIINGANHRPDLSVAAGWAGAVVLAFSASIVFVQLQSALNIIFGANLQNPDQNQGRFDFIKRFVLKRLISIGILLTLLFISIVSLSVSAMLSYLMDRYDLQGIQVVSTLLNLLVYGFLFGLLYKWMPDRSVRRNHSWMAGFFTAVMFVIGKSAIGTYIGRAAIGSAYGAAGSLIVMLVWIYYSALVFFIGAEISSFFLIPGSYEKKI
jgi:membrane protein